MTPLFGDTSTLEELVDENVRPFSMTSPKHT